MTSSSRPQRPRSGRFRQVWVSGTLAPQPKCGRLFGGFAMSQQDSNDTATLCLSRRRLLAGVAGIGALAIGSATPARLEITKGDFRDAPPYGNGTLPDGVRSRLIPNVNGLTVNVLEAGFEPPNRPLV